MVEPYLEEAPFAEFYGDAVMGSNPPSIRPTDPICNEPLDLTPTSFYLLPTTPSYMHAFDESLSDIRGYNPSFDPYYAYLEHVPRKIMWSTFFDHTLDFSVAFDEFRGHLLCLLHLF